MNWFGPSGDCGCCGCCVQFAYSDCDLVWSLCSPPGEDYSVQVTGPSSYDETYPNRESGLVTGAAAGTWTVAIYTGETLVCDTEYVIDESCTPELPCCRFTTGLYGVFSGFPTAGAVRVSWMGSGGSSRCDLSITDIEDANVSWYQALEMISGTKTDETCYDRAVQGNVNVGTGSVLTYVAIPGHLGTKDVTCFSEADAIANGNYHLDDLQFDIDIKFSSTNVRLVGVVTSNSVTTYGSPINPTAPTPRTVGSEFNITVNHAPSFCADNNFGNFLQLPTDYFDCALSASASISYDLDTWPDIELP